MEQTDRQRTVLEFLDQLFVKHEHQDITALAPISTQLGLDFLATPTNHPEEVPVLRPSAEWKVL